MPQSAILASYATVDTASTYSIMLPTENWVVFQLSLGIIQRRISQQTGRLDCDPLEVAPM